MPSQAKSAECPSRLAAASLYDAVFVFRVLLRLMESMEDPGSADPVTVLCFRSRKQLLPVYLTLKRVGETIDPRIKSVSLL